MSYRGGQGAEAPYMASYHSLPDQTALESTEPKDSPITSQDQLNPEYQSNVLSELDTDRGDQQRRRRSWRHWINGVRPPLRIFRLFMMRWYFWIFLAIIALCGVTSFFMWVGMRIKTEGKLRDGPPPGPGGVVLAFVKSIDLDEKVLRVNWMVHSGDMDYFFNDKAWQVAYNKSTTVEPDIASRVDKTSSRINWEIHEPVYGTYEIPFRSRDFLYDHYAQSQSYPLDWYAIRVFVTARDPRDGGLRPITFMQPYGVITSWEYEVDWAKSGFVLRDPARPESNIWVTSFRIKRSIGTRFFSFLIVTINWAITVSVMWLTWCMVVGRRKIPRELYAMPMTALFAVPPLRESMPGVPGVGCMIDYVGLIPNIFLIGCCTVLIIWVSILRDTTNLYPLERYGWDYPSIERPEKVGHRTEDTGGIAPSLPPL